MAVPTGMKRPLLCLIHTPASAAMQLARVPAAALEKWAPGGLRRPGAAGGRPGRRLLRGSGPCRASAAGSNMRQPAAAALPLVSVHFAAARATQSTVAQRAATLSWGGACPAFRRGASPHARRLASVIRLDGMQPHTHMHCTRSTLPAVCNRQKKQCAGTGPRKWHTLV